MRSKLNSSRRGYAGQILDRAEFLVTQLIKDSIKDRTTRITQSLEEDTIRDFYKNLDSSQKDPANAILDV